MSKGKFKILIFSFSLFAAALCAFCLCTNPFITANANSAIREWRGSYFAGAIATDENCPVAVESELITFDINEFPESYYQTPDEFSEYGAKVTASYNFYNPADYGVDMKLVFPFGRLPNYIESGFNDSARYGVSCDGEEVETVLRHTLSYYDYSFDTKTDVAKLIDGYKEDAFYYPELPVYKYSFKFKNLVCGADDGVEAELEIKDGKNLHLVADLSYSTFFNDVTLGKYVSEGYVLDVYCLGSELDFAQTQWQFYINGNAFKKTQGEAEIISSEQITFKQLALTYYDEEGAVSESDWYNAVIDRLRLNSDIREYKFFRLDDLSIGYSLLRWYEYSLYIPAHGRAVNSVTAPLYPDINGYYEPPVYSYEYLLSPAKGWADFGLLEVKINTPYYLTEENGREFQKTDYGYCFTSDGLPTGELRFSLSTSPTPEKQVTGGQIFVWVLLGIVLFFLTVVMGGLIALIVIGIVTLTKKNKNKTKK